MFRIRGLVVFLLVLAAAASACSDGNPAGPTSNETGQPATGSAPTPPAPFRAIGVGYAFDASATYRHYWTLSFGGS